MAEGIANKEQAEKCLAIARDALAAGNLEKATRFGEKSMKLYPHDEVCPNPDSSRPIHLLLQ